MIGIISKYRFLFILIIIFIVYFPSLFVFYTNDDFFFLKISNVHTLSEFGNFFNLLKGPDGLGMYRPLSTQVFYFLGLTLFNANPFFLHIISFITLFGVITLFYKLVYDLTSNKNIAFFSSLLYGVSPTHFGHLYYLATYQEILMAFFVLLSCHAYIRGKNIVTFAYFLLALMCKETAVVTPGLFIILSIYQKWRGVNLPQFRNIYKRLTPYMLTLLIYMSLRYFYYGFATGDSYVWDFSLKKSLNSLVWYVAWSLNLPENLVDFVGPGLRLNPDLLKYWSKDIIPIFELFFLECLGLLYLFIKTMSLRQKLIMREIYAVFSLSITWFLITILPVLFLPIHKFNFYLTLPLMGVVLGISYLLEKSKLPRIIKLVFVFVWVILSITSLNYMKDVHWITQGEKISARVYNFFEMNKNSFTESNIVFKDTESDYPLPWSPTAVVKNVLSNKNFFYVYHPNLADKIYYDESDGRVILSRQFLGY